MSQSLFYKANWQSLRQHVTPQWLKDAKFGIYTHWGIYSVPAFGPNATWYPYEMYRDGTPQFAHHVQTYGHPSRFGYKDFIPLFTGEKFDAGEWAELFKQAGAQFAGPVGEHHDGFAMWDSQLTPWNAARMGPKRNVVKELSEAIRRQDMRFMVAMHHAENWWFFPHWRKEFDTADPRYAGLYGPAHNLEWADGMPATTHREREWDLQAKPDKGFLDTWLGKIREVVDGYSPDLLWFDFGLGLIQENYRTEFLAYFYNQARMKGQEVAVTYKNQDLVAGSGVIDLELGRFADLTYHDWITDTTVDAGEGWGYLKDTQYKTVDNLVHYLIDNVSKNGYLLLNVGPQPDGQIPEEAKALLRGMGKWLAVNGEAIYGTTPWQVYGEGPTKMTKSGSFMEDAEVRYTPGDFRFTSKGDALYAMCLGTPRDRVTIQSFKILYPNDIASVRMLGVEQDLNWSFSQDGLSVEIPMSLPSDIATTFKIVRRNAIEQSR
jgi:alpha-L-fucosidase